MLRGSRVGAVVVLAGALGRFSGGLVHHRRATAARDARDRRHDEPGVVESWRLCRASPGTKRLVLVEGGSHIGAFEDDASRPAVVTLVADFLRPSIVNDAAAPRLDAESNVPGVLVPG